MQNDFINTCEVKSTPRLIQQIYPPFARATICLTPFYLNDLFRAGESGGGSAGGARPLRHALPGRQLYKGPNVNFGPNVNSSEIRLPDLIRRYCCYEDRCNATWSCPQSCTCPCPDGLQSLQGYLAHKKVPPLQFSPTHTLDCMGKTTLSEGRCKATWKREFKLPRREAGPPNPHDDKVDWDQ